MNKTVISGVFCLVGLLLCFMMTACSHPADGSDVMYSSDILTEWVSQTPEETPAVTTAPITQTTVPMEEETEPVTLPITETTAEETETVDPEVYFENNLFVGDSILEGLAQYVRAQRQNGTPMLSDAKFLTSITGIRVADLVGDTASYERIQYQYRGAVRELSEIVTLAAPKRLFLLIGMNDLAGGASLDDTIARYERLLVQLKSDFPTLPLVVMTSTPKTKTEWLPDYCTNPNFDSTLLREFADRLIALCETLDVPCVDIFAALADETGNLPDQFSRDNYVHINDLGAALVVGALNQFAQEDPDS